jgi:hypothetical protein
MTAKNEILAKLYTAHPEAEPYVSVLLGDPSD